MIPINHGVPTSPFFIIALPHTGEPMGNKVRMGTPTDPYQVAELTDPKTQQKIRAEIHDMWRFRTDEVQFLNAFSKLAYGITGPQLVSVMRRRYTYEFSKVEFLLLKKL
jgi:hypothetical protein